MLKKAFLVLSLFAFTLVVAAPIVPIDTVDAKRGGFSSGKKSFSNTPTNKDGVSNSSTTTKSGTTAGTTASKGGLFGGGSFMKGMMLGGLAGLLFGSMLGTGFMSQMFGLLINVIAIIAIIALVRIVWNKFSNKRQQPPGPRYPNPDNRSW